MVACEALSLAAFVYPMFSLPLLIVIGVAAFVVSWKNLETGVYILFGELFFGSRGHLLEYNIGFTTLSLRLVIFAAVFIVWSIKYIRHLSLTLSDIGEGRVRYGLLLLVIAFGILNGYSHHHSLADIFHDANAYLYLLILPAVFAVIKTREQVQNILQILAAAVLIIAFKTLALFLWFSFDLPGVATMYHWVIDQDIGEITGVVGSASRIFMQSQFYALMGFFIFALSEKKNWPVIAAAILAIIMSLSRSFWLGGVAGAVFAGFALIFYFKVKISELVKLAATLLLIAVLELGGLYAIVKISGGGFADAVASRGVNPSQEAAGGARLLLLPELLQEIKEAPVLGKGFGELVTYKSFLPDRIRPDNPEGEIRSFAFEWGYLDIALKVGILGLVIYLFFIANIFSSGWKAMQNQNAKIKMLNLGILSGLVALLVLNVTTPYLNHPLGIGYLILAALSFQIFNFEL